MYVHLTSPAVLGRRWPSFCVVESWAASAGSVIAYISFEDKALVFAHRYFYHKQNSVSYTSHNWVVSDNCSRASLFCLLQSSVNGMGQALTVSVLALTYKITFISMFCLSNLERYCILQIFWEVGAHWSCRDCPFQNYPIPSGTKVFPQCFSYANQTFQNPNPSAASFKKLSQMEELSLPSLTQGQMSSNSRESLLKLYLTLTCLASLFCLTIPCCKSTTLLPLLSAYSNLAKTGISPPSPCGMMGAFYPGNCRRCSSMAAVSGSFDLTIPEL